MTDAMVLSALAGVALVVEAAPPADVAPAPETTVRFRTDLAPRVDPVFGDGKTLRAAVDRFLDQAGAMDKVRDEFSLAVNATLADLGRLGKAKRCPESVGGSYARALAAGERYILLGRALEARFREVRRQDDLGDTPALTPDYRFKVRKVREMYGAMIRDLREMRVAFHEQLGAEMRHAGCSSLLAATPTTVDLSDPASWKLEDEPAVTIEGATGGGVPPGGDRDAGASESEPSAAPPTFSRDGGAAAADGGAQPLARAVWIVIDTTPCAEPSRLVLDGTNLGEIAAGKRTSIRVRSGPHDLCVLSASDTRACGAPGTVRRAHFHEGWSLTVRCGKPAAP